MSAPSNYRHQLRGGCHCGSIAYSFETDRDTASLIPRACQCTFCTKHGAAYISDPKGRFTLNLVNRDEVSYYRFGQKTADLVICRRCGVLTNALSETDGSLQAVVNMRSLIDWKFDGPAIETDTDDESPEERSGRRAQSWIGSVIVNGG